MKNDNQLRQQPRRSNLPHGPNEQWDGRGDEASEGAAVADRLAAYTDAVLTGQVQERDVLDMNVPKDLALTIRALAVHAEAGQVGAQPAPARLRQLKTRIMAAWDAAQSPWWARARAALQARISALGRTLARQPAWGAAIALLLIAFGVLLLAPLGAVPLPGTAEGPVGTGIWFVLGVLTIAAAVVIWIVGRRQR